MCKKKTKKKKIFKVKNKLKRQWSILFEKLAKET